MSLTDNPIHPNPKMKSQIPLVQITAAIRFLHNFKQGLSISTQNQNALIPATPVQL